MRNVVLNVDAPCFLMKHCTEHELCNASHTNTLSPSPAFTSLEQLETYFQIQIEDDNVKQSASFELEIIRKKC